MLLLMVKRKIDPKPPLVSADVRKKDVKSICCATPLDFFSTGKYLEMTIMLNPVVQHQWISFQFENI